MNFKVAKELQESEWLEDFQKKSSGTAEGSQESFNKLSKVLSCCKRSVLKHFSGASQGYFKEFQKVSGGCIGVSAWFKGAVRASQRILGRF